MLEEILQKYFGCKHPFRRKPKICGWDNDGMLVVDHLTESGNKAYDKLVGLIYDLRIIGVLREGEDHNIIETLDSIVSETQY